MAAIATLAVILAGSANASAQNAGGVSPVPVIAKLPNSIVAQFKANPEGLLAAYPAGGLGLSSRARSLALTDPSLVPILINAAKAGNEAQQAAIGAGMAEAARILAVVDPQLAQEIQQAIAQSGSESLIAAFAAASNATQTASTSHHVSTNASAAVIAGGAGGRGLDGRLVRRAQRVQRIKRRLQFRGRLARRFECARLAGGRRRPDVLDGPIDEPFEVVALGCAGSCGRS